MISLIKTLETQYKFQFDTVCGSRSATPSEIVVGAVLELSRLLKDLKDGGRFADTSITQLTGRSQVDHAACIRPLHPHRDKVTGR